MTTQLHELLSAGQVRLQPKQHGRVNAVVGFQSAQQQTVAYRVESSRDVQGDESARLESTAA